MLLLTLAVPACGATTYSPPPVVARLPAIVELMASRAPDEWTPPPSEPRPSAVLFDTVELPSARNPPGPTATPPPLARRGAVTVLPETVDRTRLTLPAAA